MGVTGVDGAVHWVFTDRGDGDLRPQISASEVSDLDRRRVAVAATPWTWLDQQHGALTVTAEHPGHHAGARADAAVTATPGVTVAVAVADCAPLLLIGSGAVAVVHVGWRGLLAGVVASAADAMVARGFAPQRAILGPCIRPRCYEFGGRDLDRLAHAFGDRVRSSTAWGTPALDLAAGVNDAGARLGLDVSDVGTCTGCSPAHYSYRTRADGGRQSLVAWVEP